MMLLTLQEDGVVLLHNPKTNWRCTTDPNQGIAHLPLSDDERARVTAHWERDVGGQTRAERWRAGLPKPSPADLIAYAVSRRRRTEAEGVEFAGRRVPIATMQELRALDTLPDAQSIPLVINGERCGRITGVQLRQLYAAFVAHAAKTYEVLDRVIAAVEAGTITTKAQIDQEFVT